MQLIIEKFKSLNIPEREINWLLSELNYQSKRWNKDTTSTAGVHDIFEFATFIKDYNNEMIHILSRKGEPVASEEAMHIIRKIAAMCISALYQNGLIDSLKIGFFDDHTMLKNPTHASNLINHFLNQMFEAQLFMRKDANLQLNFIFNVCLSVALKMEKLPLRENESCVDEFKQEHKFDSGSTMTMIKGVGMVENI